MKYTLLLLPLLLITPAAAAPPLSSGICQVSRTVNNRNVTRLALCGVGKVAGVRNLALARQTADSRARVDLLKVRRRYIQVFGEFSPSRRSDERLLAGSSIELRWRDPRTHMLYSLAVLELER